MSKSTDPTELPQKWPHTAVSWAASSPGFGLSSCPSQHYRMLQRVESSTTGYLVQSASLPTPRRKLSINGRLTWCDTPRIAIVHVFFYNDALEVARILYTWLCCLHNVLEEWLDSVHCFLVNICPASERLGHYVLMEVRGGAVNLVICRVRVLRSP